MRPHELLEASDHGGDEQACHSAMEAVGDATVIAFAELITEIRVGDGITETRQIFSAVAGDVAVVECDNLTVVSGQHITEGRLAVSSLALQADIEVLINQSFKNGLDARPVIPNETHALREYGEELLRQAKL